RPAAARALGAHQHQLSVAGATVAAQRDRSATDEEGLGAGEAAPLLDHAHQGGAPASRAHRRRASRASRRSALSRASSRLVTGRSAARTPGWTPAPRRTPPPPRFRPLGVKYSPTVMSSPPPLGRPATSWKT